MTRLRTLLAVICALALLGATLAQAAATPKPPTGPWKLNGATGGFTLRKGTGSKRGKIFLSDLHFKTGLYAGCPSKVSTVRVLGRYALKTFTRGGYTTWGVGRNTGGDVTPRAGKVRVGGKTYNGEFYVVWNYANPRQVFGGSIQFGTCLSQFTFGTPR